MWPQRFAIRAVVAESSFNQRSCQRYACGPQLFRSNQFAGCDPIRGTATGGGRPRHTIWVMVKATQHLFRTLVAVARDLASLASSAMRSRAQLAAENLFLRKQLALYQERGVKPRRGDDATRLILAGLSRFLTGVTY
jgi:hypothetical protein